MVSAPQSGLPVVRSVGLHNLVAHVETWADSLALLLLLLELTAMPHLFRHRPTHRTAHSGALPCAPAHDYTTHYRSWGRAGTSCSPLVSRELATFLPCGVLVTQAIVQPQRAEASFARR